MIEMPPLRERSDDVVLLAKVFLERFAEENNKSGLTFTPQAVARIQDYSWPGNVRELENKIKRAVILASDKKIKPLDLGFDASGKGDIKSLQEIREKTEKEHIVSALERNNWNISKTAKMLKTSRTTLYDPVSYTHLRAHET